MTEIQTFYGDWLVQCDQVNAGFSQRFSISGSENSDGVHPGTPGTRYPSVRTRMVYKNGME